MLVRCPSCQKIHTAVAEDGEAAAVEFWQDRILSYCEEHHIAVGPGDTVSERDAAAILQKSRLTLRNQRLGACPIQFQRFGARIFYKLEDIARHIARSCEDE